MQAGQTAAQITPANENFGIYAPDLTGLAVDNNGNIYGLTWGFVALGVNNPVALVWQMSDTGGPITLLAESQFPTESDTSTFTTGSLTLSGNVLYGTTSGSQPGYNTVFSVPVSGLPTIYGFPTGGPFNILGNFTSPVDPEIVVQGNFVYGVLDFDSVFKLPVGAGTPQTPQFFPITVGSGTWGGLAADGSTMLGVLNAGSAGGTPSIFSVNFATATPTFQTLTTFSSLNQSPESGLAVDSLGNAYGLSYGSTGSVDVYELSVSPPPQTSVETFTWSGAVNKDWSDSKNWQGGVAPVPGQEVNLIFPASAKHRTNIDDVPTLIVDALQIDGNYVIKGSGALGLDGTLTVSAPKLCSISNPIVLTGQVTATVSRGELDLDGEIGGSGGLVIVGPGTLGLGHSNNAYSGDTVLQSGTLAGKANGCAGTGTLRLLGGTLESGGRPDHKLELANQVIVGGNVIISGSKKDEPDAVLLQGSVMVTASSILFLSTAFNVTNGIDVSAGSTLTLLAESDSTDNLTGLFSGHIDFDGGSRGLVVKAQGQLAPGAMWDLLEGSTLDPQLIGDGAINVAGGALYCGELDSSTLANFGGTVTLTLGFIYTEYSLGTGPLNLIDGDLEVFGHRALNLTNSQTTLSGRVVLEGCSPSDPLNVRGAVVVTGDATLFLRSTLALHGLSTDQITFFQPVTFAGETLLLTFAGDGSVTLPNSSSPQVRTGGSDVTVMPD